MTRVDANAAVLIMVAATVFEVVGLEFCITTLMTAGADFVAMTGVDDVAAVLMMTVALVFEVT